MPATRGLLDEFRNELKADFRSLDHKVDNLSNKIGFVETSLGARIDSVESSLGSHFQLHPSDRLSFGCKTTLHLTLHRIRRTLPKYG